MDVKKTKSGKLSFELSCVQREVVFDTLVNFLETESFKLMHVRMKGEPEILRHLNYSVLNEFILKNDFALSLNVTKRWTLKRSEAIALMWLLREDSRIAVLTIKSALHKILS